MDKRAFASLIEYLERVPAIQKPIAFGDENKLWWVKFSINIQYELAWSVVQELGHVINLLSLNERLPTVFYPVSPPPYMNGGPDDYLSWVIETKDKNFKPSTLMEWLEGRLPNPVDELDNWEVD